VKGIEAVVESEARQDKRGKMKEDLCKIEAARHGGSAFSIERLKMRIQKAMAHK